MDVKRLTRLPRWLILLLLMLLPATAWAFVPSGIIPKSTATPILAISVVLPFAYLFLLPIVKEWGWRWALRQNAKSSRVERYIAHWMLHFISSLGAYSLAFYGGYILSLTGLSLSYEGQVALGLLCMIALEGLAAKLFFDASSYVQGLKAALAGWAVVLLTLPITVIVALPFFYILNYFLGYLP